MSMLLNAEDETRLAGAEAALRGFWEDYLGFRWVKYVDHGPSNWESLRGWGKGDTA
jgi:hypothetical protein